MKMKYNHLMKRFVIYNLRFLIEVSKVFFFFQRNEYTSHQEY